MNYEVLIISDAEEDIFEIYTYVATYDSIEKAKYLVTELKETCLSLSTLPTRGHIPPELERIGVFDFKEIHFKPYRIIYQIIETTVFVHGVLDGHRDLQQLLQKRLLR